jgi:uncharacterized protein YbjQ (UPF0145 family)
MIVTTLDHVAGHAVGDTLGLVRGVSSWTRRVTKTCAGGIRHLAVHGLADLDRGLDECRLKAMEALKKEAEAMGATAVIGLQTEMKELSSGACMVVVTGVAVRTYRLPAATPAFQTPQAISEIGFGFPAGFPERPAIEGSVLHH